MTLETTIFDIARYLETVDDANEFLNAAIIGLDTSPEHVLRAIEIACRSEGGAALAPPDIAGYIHAYFRKQA